MNTVAVLSMHTSPLAQAGAGDSGGMNVYIRQLCTGLARRGVRCEVFTRAEHADQPAMVAVEPGLSVHHVPAGPLCEVTKESLPALVPAWTEGVAAVLDRLEDDGVRVDAIHANYWLSGVAGHRLKHERNVPLISTFHTLDRVKAEPAPGSAARQRAEQEIVGCSDLLLASCGVEAEQLVTLYGAQRHRIEIVAPGVDHAIFAPGDRRQARRALGWPLEDPRVLFVGRIQPLKGPSVAVHALSHALRTPSSRADDRLSRAALVVIGGPSGVDGPGELAAMEGQAAAAGLSSRVHILAPQSHELLSTSYRASDVVIVPSRSESFGLVALEASACGVPVVASAVGGLTTLVEHGRTGYLVEGRDPARFGAHLAQLLGDPELADSFGRAGAQRAGAYTWVSAAERLQRRVRRIATRELVACR